MCRIGNNVVREYMEQKLAEQRMRGLVNGFAVLMFFTFIAGIAIGGTFF